MLTKNEYRILSYEDIKKIIDILAQSPELNDEDFRKYKGLVIRMCELSEKYMEGK